MKMRTFYLLSLVVNILWHQSEVPLGILAPINFLTVHLWISLLASVNIYFLVFFFLNAETLSIILSDGGEKLTYSCSVGGTCSRDWLGFGHGYRI